MKIEFDQIHVTLGGKEILKGVDVTARDRQMTGIIGPNGCGKSTLLKTLFGIVPRNGGTIRLGEKDISGYGRKEISSMVGYVGQEVPVAFDFSVRDVVEMALYNTAARKKGAGVRRNRREIVDHALEEMGILHLSDRSILNLSGGERKMVFLARSIAQGCDTIILDEPTNHLDIRHQVFIMDYLRQSGKTILIVLHDLNLACSYCDNLFLLKEGENVVSGTPREVLNRERVEAVFRVDGEYMPSGYDQAGFYLRLGKK